MTIFNFYSKNIKYEKSEINEKIVEENFNHLNFKIFKVEEQKESVLMNKDYSCEKNKEEGSKILGKIKGLKLKKDLSCCNIKKEDIYLNCSSEVKNEDLNASMLKTSKRDTKSTIKKEDFLDEDIIMKEEDFSLLKEEQNNNIHKQINFNELNNSYSDIRFQLLKHISMIYYVNNLVIEDLSNLNDYTMTYKLLNFLNKSNYD